MLKTTDQMNSIRSQKHITGGTVMKSHDSVLKMQIDTIFQKKKMILTKTTNITMTSRQNMKIPTKPLIIPSSRVSVLHRWYS